MGLILPLAIASCAGCIVAKFAVSLRVKVLEKELQKEREDSRLARKERNESIEAVNLLKREVSKLETKQASLEKGLYDLAMALAELERAEEALQVAA